MKETEILIVGGSAAGLTTAITARRYNSEVDITIVRKDKRVLVPCGIPYIFGTLNSAEEDLIPDKVLTNNDINLEIDEVTSVNKEAKTVTTANGQNFKYEKLILAVGSQSLVPPISGTDLDNVFTVQKDPDYLSEMKESLQEVDDLVVVGGGFMGLEFADECNKMDDMNVTVIERLSYPLSLACDEEICKKVEDKLTERGLNILTGRTAKSFKGNGEVEYVEMENGQKIDADAVILSVGVKPEIQLALDAGLKADPREGIWVDDFMRTSNDNIFAVGDCARKECYLCGEAREIRLASIATTEGRVAGANLGGIRRRMSNPVGIFSTQFGDLAVGSAGRTEKEANEMDIEIVIGESTAVNRHPGKIPGAQEMGVKLIFEKDTGLLLGGQVYGGESVGEKINFIGALIQHEMRADEICTFQMGTHPLLTASPVSYQLIDAAQKATTKLSEMRSNG